MLIAGFPSAHPFAALLGLGGAFVKGVQLEEGKLVEEDNDRYSLICLNNIQSPHQKGRGFFVALPFLWNRFEQAGMVLQGVSTERKKIVSLKTTIAFKF